MSQTKETTDAIETEPRSGYGKGAARALRRAGRLPGVIYGSTGESSSFSLDYRTVERRYLTGSFLSTPLDLSIDGEVVRALPKQVQLHPVRDDLLHVDFLRLDKGAVIAVEVPVHFLNEEESPGLKRGGVLNVVRHTVELNCPADAIPEFIEVNLAGTEIGDSIHISAVQLPEKVTPVIRDRDFTIAGVVAPAVMPEEEVAEEAAAAEGEGEGEESAEAGESAEKKDESS
ncbi:MAG: 50S ribosomal protein L25/general stress protein Ctc [Hyphomicrobiales bacterium]|nr:50S ribosomal protein L25/general stress protein Ctc [Hyphomicrobiales bacterium]